MPIFGELATRSKDVTIRVDLDHPDCHPDRCLDRKAVVKIQVNLSYELHWLQGAIAAIVPCTPFIARGYSNIFLYSIHSYGRNNIISMYSICSQGDIVTIVLCTPIVARS